MTRVDLDEFPRAKWHATPEQLAAVVAELRAAREVVDAARGHLLLGRRDQDPGIKHALATYDEAVG